MSKTIKHDTMAFMKSIGLGDGKSNTNIERKENTKSLDSKSKGKNDKSKQSVDSKNNNNNNKFNTKSANSKPTSTKENANKPLPTPRVIESGKFVAASNKAAVADKTNNKNKEHNKISNEVSIATSNMWWNEKHESSAPLINLNGEMSWYEVDTSMDNFNSTQYKLPKHVLDQIHSRIDILYKEEVSNYHRSKKLNAVNSSDQQWLDGIIKSGTLSDKIAALTLRVSESPVHELETLDLLVAMANKKEQRISKLALESLKDLLINNLLPSNRKLTPLSNKPLGHPEMTIKLLLLFKYENELILRIIQIINALEYGLQSNLEYYKKYCMEIVFDWLNQKPEQEARLLRILVNKMGDPNNKILLKCNEVLRKLCKNHPGMVPIVITEIWQLIGRENIQPRVMYSGVIYLSQIRLNDGNDEINSNIALKLIEYYIHIFEKTLDMQQSSSHGHESKKKSKSSNSNHNNEYSSKLLSIVLIGINRIFPYLKDKSALIKHIDVLFKIVHSANFSSLTQSLTLLSHIIFDNDSNKTAKKTNNKSNNDNNENNHSIDKSLIDRFYRSLYSTLLISQVFTRTHNTLFLNLLYRSLKRDTNETRVMAFVKRILIGATHSSSQICAGLIYLVSEICKSHPSILDMLLKPEIETEKTSDSTNGQDDEKSVDDSLKDSYHQLGNFDGDKRAPEYSCAGTPGMWEVPLLRMHYHPSVQSFVKSFSSTETNHVITYPGDPTVDFSLSSFLNRFSYKNPKKRQFANGNHRSISLQLSEAPVNSSEFINLSYEEVSPDKEFFHRFFNTQINLRNSGKSRFKRGKDDDDSDGSDASDYDEFGSDIDGGDDDEAEMDKFADKLANDLMEKEDDVDIDDDDDDMEDFDAEVSDGSDSDNEAFDEPENEDLDFADYIKSQKKNKRQMQESDDDDEVEVFVSDKKAQKTTLQNKRKYESLPTSKKQQKSSMSAFASYEDYEEEMDNIMNQQKMKNGKSSASNTSNQPITSKKGNSNKFAKNK